MKWKSLNPLHHVLKCRFIAAELGSASERITYKEHFCYRALH
jgi:hypothetical protein